MAVLTSDEVRMYIMDNAEDNYLLDAEEFKDEYLDFCMTLAVDSWNIIPPSSGATLDTFPSKSLLLYGTCWHAFLGRAAKYNRNSLSYNDGGIALNIEEKGAMYEQMASEYQGMFAQAARALKTSLNMEDGWSDMNGDQSLNPYF